MMFQNARIKLTLWYLLIIMLVSFLFSIGVYKILTREVERFARIQRFRIERGFGENHVILPPNLDSDFVSETKARIAATLSTIDFVILIISGALGYFLAGKTLLPIKSMLDEQNRFITDASHELRTPLTALKSSMEVFLRAKNSSISEANLLVKESIEEVDHLTSLSNALLQLSQYQKPDSIVKMDTISIAEILKEVVIKLSPLAKEKKLIINKDIKDFQVRGNKLSLSDLFVILLDNAIKYTKKGSVAVSTETKDGFVNILVKDTGIGIAEKDTSHIFDRFYRADESRSEANVFGYGLGLSIAKRIVDIHRGKISVESKVGEGSTFMVSLPSDFS